MNTHKRYDWNEVQKLYDTGLSYRDLNKLIGIAYATLRSATKRGVFKSRTTSESSKLAVFKHDRKHDWTPERRKAQSESKKKLYAEHPEKHPNRKLANNRQKMSYPERLVYDWLTSQNIEFIHQRKIDKYYVDFTIGSLCIEIDGKYFHDVEYDKIRDARLTELGFSVRRISASNILSKGASIVLDESISPELLSTHIELSKPHICPICNTEYFDNKVTCSSDCKIIYMKEKSTNSLPPVSKEELDTHITDGKSLVEIGKMYGVSDNAVRKWCTKYDIDHKKRKDIDIQVLTQMVKDGTGISKIATHFGVTRERINNMLTQHKLTAVSYAKVKIPDELVSKVKQLIMEGKRNSEITPIVGLDQKQVSSIRSKFATLIQY